MIAKGCLWFYLRRSTSMSVNPSCGLAEGVWPAARPALAECVITLIMDCKIKRIRFLVHHQVIKIFNWYFWLYGLHKSFIGKHQCEKLCISAQCRKRFVLHWVHEKSRSLDSVSNSWFKKRTRFDSTCVLVQRPTSAHRFLNRTMCIVCLFLFQILLSHDNFSVDIELW